MISRTPIILHKDKVPSSITGRWSLFTSLGGHLGTLARGRRSMWISEQGPHGPASPISKKLSCLLPSRICSLGRCVSQSLHLIVPLRKSFVRCSLKDGDIKVLFQEACILRSLAPTPAIASFLKKSPGSIAEASQHQCGDTCRTLLPRSLCLPLTRKHFWLFATRGYFTALLPRMISLRGSSQRS